MPGVVDRPDVHPLPALVRQVHEARGDHSDRTQSVGDLREGVAEKPPHGQLAHVAADEPHVALAVRTQRAHERSRSGRAGGGSAAGEWLDHVVDNIEWAQRHVSGCDFESFAGDRLRVDAVERCIERIIEAVLRIGPERMSEVAPELPLQKMRGLANRLRHEYEAVDRRLIWDTIVDELPALRTACRQAIAGRR